MPWSASVSMILDGVYEWKMHLPVGMRQHMGILPGGNTSKTPAIKTLVCDRRLIMKKIWMDSAGQE